MWRVALSPSPSQNEVAVAEESEETAQRECSPEVTQAVVVVVAEAAQNDDVAVLAGLHLIRQAHQQEANEQSRAKRVVLHLASARPVSLSPYKADCTPPGVEIACGETHLAHLITGCEVRSAASIGF